MVPKVMIFLLLFLLVVEIFAQKPITDELQKHLSAAETFQISGDLPNAAIENRAIVGIGLQRIGNIAIEEGKFNDAVKFLAESTKYSDSSENRTNLAVAYSRLNEIDKAIEEAKLAVAMDAKYPNSHYILGNLYFTKGDYELALPPLEKVLLLAPDFESVRALGITYLHLKQPERTKLLFEEIIISLKKDSPEMHNSFGQAYEQTNYPLDAEREFKRALSINPKQPRSNFFLGYVILQHGGSERLSESIDAFEKELQLSPNDFYTNFFAGVAASSQNKHEKAIQFLKKAIQISPKRGEAYLFLGQSQFELNDLDSAEKSLRISIQLEKTDEQSKSQANRTHFLLGRLLIKTNRKDEGEKELAIAKKFQQDSLDTARTQINQILGQVVEKNVTKQTNFEIATALTPGRSAELKIFKSYLKNILAQAFNNLGVIATQSGQIDEAISLFTSALVWNPEFPNLDRNLGILSFRNGQYDKAILPLSNHLKLNPKDNLIRKLLGTSFYSINNFAKTVETLKPIETTITSDQELAYFYGISLIQQKRNAEAVLIFNKLAQVSQKNAESLLYAAQGFMILGDYERAIREFRVVISVAPETLKANYFIGQSLIRLNRFDHAEKAFANELELNPNDVLAKYSLALTLIERKIQPEKTISVLEEALIIKSDYADAHYQLGKIHLEKGKIEKAIEHLESAVSADSSKDYSHYQLSIAYRKASRKEEADRELKLYQKLKSENRKIEPTSPMGNNANSPK
jgi:tetratricopeptide (TPR) repeat protein